MAPQEVCWLLTHGSLNWSGFIRCPCKHVSWSNERPSSVLALCGNKKETSLCVCPRFQVAYQLLLIRHRPGGTKAIHRGQGSKVIFENATSVRKQRDVHVSSCFPCQSSSSVLPCVCVCVEFSSVCLSQDIMSPFTPPPHLQKTHMQTSIKCSILSAEPWPPGQTNTEDVRR